MLSPDWKIEGLTPSPFSNELAADILMPWLLLTPEIEEGNSSADTFAEAFDMSESAMAIRRRIIWQ